MIVEKEIEKYMITCDVILYSYGNGARDFKVLDIKIPDIYYSMDNFDCVIDEASEELGDYGQTISIIHRKLINEYGIKTCYHLKVSLNFHDTFDYMTNEADIDIEYKYSVIETDVDMSKY